MDGSTGLGRTHAVGLRWWTHPRSCVWTHPCAVVTAMDASTGRGNGRVQLFWVHPWCKKNNTVDTSMYDTMDVSMGGLKMRWVHPRLGLKSGGRIHGPLDASITNMWMHPAPGKKKHWMHPESVWTCPWQGHGCVQWRQFE
ncbi:hypothetical protein B0H12DRAFT_1077922 [Mycena haematopus]|nr:hypothetical protein B0H12DRAFT_1077922 [Mycena haematopus]